MTTTLLKQKILIQGKRFGEYTKKEIKEHYKTLGATFTNIVSDDIAFAVFGSNRAIESLESVMRLGKPFIVMTGDGITGFVGNYNYHIPDTLKHI